MSPERALPTRMASAALVLLLCVAILAGPWTAGAHAEPAGFPNPCDLPVVSNVCGAVGNAASSVATATGEFVMRGVTEWVTDAAVWVTGKVGDLVNSTTSPDLTASWFQGEYAAMLAVAGALALLMLMLAVIQSVLRQDVWMLVRSAFGYLPMAFILSAVAIAATGLLVAVTDEIAGAVVGSLGAGQASNLLQSVGDAYKNALDQSSGIPLFGVFLGAIVLAIGGFVLWLEMIIRDAAIYICVFFLPLTFVGMIWPATSRWARRLVELLVAIILAKFVIVAILSLASAAITNTNSAAPSGDGTTFEQMIAGAALLVLAAWSPFALLRLIPMMELAAASVTSQRASMSRAAGSAGIQTPAAYMRQAMDRNSRPSTSPANATTGGTTYWQSRSAERSSERTTDVRQGESAGAEGRVGSKAGPSSSSPGGAVYPTGQQRSTTASSRSARGSTPTPTTEAPPASSAPPPTQQPRRPEPPPEPGPPREGGRT
jgi:hypothetical protein